MSNADEGHRPPDRARTRARLPGAGAGLLVAAATSDDVPAFDASDLAEPAGDNWPAAGGSLANDRYSTLDEIDTSNVKQLQGVWKTDLRNSGTEAKYSGESQPVVYNGVIYVTTGKNDVFAVDVETGKILWQYEGNLDQEIDTICCGWLNRGVAIGDGKVYQGQLDGKVVALDAKTGDVVWTRQLVQLAGRAGDHRGSGLRRRARVHRRRRSRPRHARVPRGARP